MNIALIILYILTAINLLYTSNKHNLPQKNYNFWSTLYAGVIQWILIWWALGWRFI